MIYGIRQCFDEFERLVQAELRRRHPALGQDVGQPNAAFRVSCAEMGRKRLGRYIRNLMAGSASGSHRRLPCRCLRQVKQDKHRLSFIPAMSVLNSVPD